MASRKVIITDEAALELQEIVESRREFDESSALKLPQEILERIRNALEHPRMNAYAGHQFGTELRRFPHKSCVVVYAIFEDKLAVTHVFGPGRDWQKRV